MSTAPARRVLVVEDDREIRGVVSAALSRERYVVTEAADGNAAIAACRRADPDVIVLDLGLPQLATFATEYRKMPGSTGRIIVISATDRGAESAARVRAATFFSKPFSLRELLAEVRRLAELPPTQAPALMGRVMRIP